MSEPTAQRVCFVIMGFGLKTDYESGRTLDLDATYEAIIRPAAESCGLRCIRADEIAHSGVIDTPMYEMLLRADLVIADISTGNVNAVYELGVRHALRPWSTIVMKEAEGRFHFDLDHLNLFQYEHLGKDIGFREVTRARTELSSLIGGLLADARTDSPVYTYLPKLQQPHLSDADYADLLDDAEAAQEKLGRYLADGKLALAESRMADAAEAFAAAARMKPGEPYIVQQLALATYKSRQPSELEALITGRTLLDQLEPEDSNDPETLGISGAIRKRLWLLTHDSVQLDSAIRLYARGYEVRRDYYNGENYAICLDLRAAEQTDEAERQYDRMTARKVRQSLEENLLEIMGAPNFDERSDQMWIFATLANCAFALGDSERGANFEAQFLAQSPARWEIDTYELGKQHVLSLS